MGAPHTLLRVPHKSLRYFSMRLTSLQQITARDHCGWKQTMLAVSATVTPSRVNLQLLPSYGLLSLLVSLRFTDGE